MQYTAKLVTATHPELDSSPAYTKKYIRFGASPRAAQALITAAKVRALMAGRFNVAYDDINALAFPVLRHRIKLSYESITAGLDNDTVIAGLLNELNGKPADIKPIDANEPAFKKKARVGK